jgi:valyl-tRNA synthetase
MGEKTLNKVYEPGAVEERWAPVWAELGLTAPAPPSPPAPGSEKPSFSMVIPPPNITGALHVGHALNSTLQDVLARYKRMKGFNVLWLPGIDHAGIATQNVVERQLAAEGLDRHKLGREEFLKRVWLRFTMDEGLSRAVREVFVTLYAEGLIYRGDYIINWCPRCHTALSDLEVQFEEVAGSLWYMLYPMP